MYIIIMDGNSLLTLNTICKLSIISAVALHSSSACTASPISEGWYLDDDKIKV